MNLRSISPIPSTLLLTLTVGVFQFPMVAQNATVTSQGGVPTIRTETREVLVDTVVTDKHGKYLGDLKMQDFKVWEDNKEQTISSFSFEQDGINPAQSKPHYMVLFFDNSTMDFVGQAKARDAAAKFLAANAGQNRLIAIAEFDGSIHITQNFTADGERLKKVVAGIKGSHVNPNADNVELASLGTPPGMPMLNNSLSRMEGEFGMHSVMSSLRDLAKGLASVQGRKTVVMLTEGFVLTPEAQSELTAVIDSCNKANVAVYPIDVRGLIAPGVDMGAGKPQSQLRDVPLSERSPQLKTAAFTYSEHAPRLIYAAYFGQHGGTGGGGGGGGSRGGGGMGGGGHAGGGPVGGTGGGRGTGGTGTTGTGGRGAPVGGAPGYGSNPYNSFSELTQPRQIVPSFPSSASDNQQVLYALAEGTGGFVILNTNDLLGGLDKIAKDQSQYYVLGYKPAVNPEGSCHTLRVKVEVHGSVVRSRSGYCNVKPQDLLAGNPIEKTLEAHAAGELPGNVTAAMQAPYFYTAPNTARVNLSLDIPSTALQFEKVKGKQHASINVLGIAYKGDDTAVARFSDTVDFDFEDKKEVEDFQKKPFHYENQFEIGTGDYKLRVVFSSGNESFGKLEAPLAIDPYKGNQFSLSSIALCDHYVRAADINTGLDSELLQNKTPLIARGMQFQPVATNRFKTTDDATLYVEMYAPALVKMKPPAVTLVLKIIDRKTGKAKVNAGMNNATQSMQTGNLTIPLGLKLPVSQLGAGSYRLELSASDSAGAKTPVRTAEFEVE